MECSKSFAQCRVLDRLGRQEQLSASIAHDLPEPAVERCEQLEFPVPCVHQYTDGLQLDHEQTSR